ncbi:MAG TPA: helix-turn-helix domain-containing protein [Gaiellaceae bacterium]
MFEIGTSLREARLRQGVDFPAAEQATKIRGKYLRALENEQFALLPAETYVRGFLRAYADYLGLDGQLYVDEYDSRFVSAGQAQRATRRSNERRSRRLETLVVLGVLAAIALATIFVVGAWTASSHHANAPSAPAAAKKQAVAVPRAPGLAVTAVRGPSYVAIRRGNAAGRVVFQGTISRGHTEPFTGRRFWLTVATPENLRIKVRGTTIHVGGNRPRVITITPSGWSVD